METVDMENIEAKMPDSFNLEFLKERTAAVLRNDPKIWEKIRLEYADLKSIYMGYFLYVVLVPTAVLFLMALVSSETLYHVVLSFVSMLLTPFVFAFVMEQVASRLESQVDRVNALKLVVYTLTPAVLTKVFAIIPQIEPIITLLGSIYSIYLMFKAAPLFVTIKEGKGLQFWGFSIGLSIVVMMLVVTFFTFFV